MNIDNVVMVRAMNHLPFDGELVPSYEGKRLVFDRKSDFVFLIRKKVQQELKNKLGRDLVLYIDSPDSKLCDEMMEAYKPLVGGYYTTTLSFSLNGMVPDDMNNNFTDMKIAVLDPLKNHLTEDFVTIDAIDTTIKGRISVSSDAILLIEDDLFNSLSEVEKSNLLDNYNVKLFKGGLRDAVDRTLEESGYPVLPLIQKRELKNINECPLREEMLNFEDKFAESVGASRLLLQNLTMMYCSDGVLVDDVAHSKLSEEFENNLVVEKYYRDQLYNFLLNKVDSLGVEVSDEDRYYLFTEYIQSEEVMERITSCIIDACGGLDNFKIVMQEYNKYVIDNYLTNKEIIDSISNGRKR